MPEPFKNLFNKTIISGMSEHFTRVWPEFDRRAFVTTAAKSLGTLELKERSAQITAAMVTFLPDDFEKAAAVSDDTFCDQAEKLAQLALQRGSGDNVSALIVRVEELSVIASWPFHLRQESLRRRTFRPYLESV